MRPIQALYNSEHHTQPQKINKK
ncbi:MAG: hypothetical protein LBH05_00855 [Deferribacteraceae bacterium]|nr:hypothetical protein [Deferribacteraceae bacterium]